MNKEMISIQAHLEGEQVVVKNIGKMRKVSEMELVILCTFTRLALLDYFSQITEPEISRQGLEKAEKLKQTIKEKFGTKNFDGLSRLAQSAVAILSSQRLGQYIVEVEE